MVAVPTTRVDAMSVPSTDDGVAAAVVEIVEERFVAAGFDVVEQLGRLPFNDPEHPEWCLELLDAVSGLGDRSGLGASGHAVGSLFVHGEFATWLAATAWVVPHGEEVELSNQLEELAGAQKCLDADQPPPVMEVPGLDPTTTRETTVRELGVGDQALRIDLTIMQPALDEWMAAALNVNATIAVARVGRGAITILRSGFGTSSVDIERELILAAETLADLLGAQSAVSIVAPGTSTT